MPSKYSLARKNRIDDDRKKETDIQKQIARATNMTDEGYRQQLTALRTYLTKNNRAQLVQGQIARDGVARYNSAIRTNDGKLGRTRGVGQMVTRAYRTIRKQPSGTEQPVNSGNGNSPPTAVSAGRTFTSNRNVQRNYMSPRLQRFRSR